ncbi:hypothetical protein F4861DRAFT_508392 [Xylaria intraflava]|nr:hypothetical protein F4861DRAFT_508392 [Xylaria intraflava]
MIDGWLSSMLSLDLTGVLPFALLGFVNSSGSVHLWYSLRCRLMDLNPEQVYTWLATGLLSRKHGTQIQKYVFFLFLCSIRKPCRQHADPSRAGS